ncbi:TetR/AcrR family transcriptional regulator [Silvibacterium sp.]|uniref:TetR/AcrR family transcriptional regulator n=1 Tax=Silvibacterium sp. TaxID=1964179 RepID=UPI0039E53F2D
MEDRSTSSHTRPGTEPPAAAQRSDGPRRQQRRAARTRALLLKAAEEIFVRDGFERAALTDIAKHAGRTRGAFHAQFKNKEELFICVVETHMRRQAARLQAMAASPDADGTHSNSSATSAPDTELSSAVLMMEFRLYALRHPSLAKQISITLDPSSSPGEAMRTPDAHGQDGLTRKATAASLTGALLDALQIGLKSSPHGLDPSVVERFLDAMLKTTQEMLEEREAG